MLLVFGFQSRPLYWNRPVYFTSMNIYIYVHVTYNLLRFVAWIKRPSPRICRLDKSICYKLRYWPPRTNLTRIHRYDYRLFRKITSSAVKTWNLYLGNAYLHVLCTKASIHYWTHESSSIVPDYLKYTYKLFEWMWH